MNEIKHEGKGGDITSEKKEEVGVIIDKAAAQFKKSIEEEAYVEGIHPFDVVDRFVLILKKKLK